MLTNRIVAAILACLICQSPAWANSTLNRAQTEWCERGVRVGVQLSPAEAAAPTIQDRMSHPTIIRHEPIIEPAIEVQQVKQSRGKKILKIVIGVAATIAAIVVVTGLSLPKS